MTALPLDYRNGKVPSFGKGVVATGPVAAPTFPTVSSMIAPTTGRSEVQ